MVTISKPRPGTVAAAQPMPDPVGLAIRLVEEGTSLEDTVARLASGFPAAELQSAQLWWVRRMPKERWRDHQPSTVLRALEQAVARTNDKVRGHSGHSG